MLYILIFVQKSVICSKLNTIHKKATSHRCKPSISLHPIAHLKPVQCSFVVYNFLCLFLAFCAFSVNMADNASYKQCSTLIWSSNQVLEVQSSIFRTNASAVSSHKLHPLFYKCLLTTEFLHLSRTTEPKYSVNMSTGTEASVSHVRKDVFINQLLFSSESGFSASKIIRHSSGFERNKSVH